MLFMILLPREDPTFGFEGLSKTVSTLSWRNNYVPTTIPDGLGVKTLHDYPLYPPVGVIHARSRQYRHFRTQPLCRLAH